VHPGPAAPTAGTERARNELAKAWLLRVIERTPLEDITDVEIAWLAREAGPLIGGIVDDLGDRAPPEVGLPAEARERAAGLAHLRHGEGAASQIPRDLAALQALLIESLGRDVPEREPGDFARSVRRLAEIFGELQADVTESMVRERAGGARRDELTGLPGHAELHEWLQILLAEQRRYGHPFALALVDIEGLGRINDAYGRPAGDRMLAAVAAVIRNQIRIVDRPFRLGEDEFCVLAPHHDAEGVLPMADRLATVIEGSQSAEGPRVTVAIGIASCPEHGESEGRLLEVAEEATYSAKAAGRAVSVAGGNHASLQDR
jgi:diguanylate cyclase (GGDEF)-like protein